MDEVFRALADPGRRCLLDSLNRRTGQTLRELCGELDMARQSVSKHLAVLITANLVTTVRRGREKLHYLNAEPINAIADRWINQYHLGRVQTLGDLKTALEQRTMDKPEFVYTSYISTTPEKLWRALTEPEFTRQYWGGLALVSDWQVGSRVDLQYEEGGPVEDQGQVVLVAEPYTRLSYSWHQLQPMHGEIFGLTAAELAEENKRRRSKVTFLLEPAEQQVKLTVVHDDFDADSLMHKAISGQLPQSGGWPQLVSGLKTLLETGKPVTA
ncbi:ArsR family transcriptional regulator [Actinosynnema sp. ALI-1.44]|uniref:ArsR/SmtB family transcription factor n=1 Tax=Actinosynnema sp. ALI-1.44 TaxID=1933779 RepID=UPI00097CBF43|nr:metalloregulator ArsR/SmtB family transcription factor [Actinosynnema sp. ALI-1.44]ONI70457.1 ArsR family transcriptional regulator [Actinosynnema sp. ALI-1.44]